MYLIVDSDTDQESGKNTSETLNNQQLNYLVNSSLFSYQNYEGYSQNSGDQQNNIDFGQSILTSNSTVNDEFNFDRLGPFEKLCSLCDNPTPSNM